MQHDQHDHKYFCQEGQQTQIQAITTQDASKHNHHHLPLLNSFNGCVYGLADIQAEFEGKSKNEGNIKLIVIFANAGPNPRTMMIEPLNAGIAFVAMGCARWSVDEAFTAILEAQGVGFGDNGVGFSDISHVLGHVGFVEGNFAELFLLVVQKYSLKDAWILEGEANHHNDHSNLEDCCKCNECWVLVPNNTGVVEQDANQHQCGCADKLLGLRQKYSALLVVLVGGNISHFMQNLFGFVRSHFVALHCLLMFIYAVARV